VTGFGIRPVRVAKPPISKRNILTQFPVPIEGLLAHAHEPLWKSARILWTFSQDGHIRTAQTSPATSHQGG
jgi:hypothetical protein